MDRKVQFFITDVFAEDKYSGNQLATLLNFDSLSDDEMQQITREIYFSETTFIMSDKPRNGGYDVRIFTPEQEIDFAGHPTLGTAFLIHKLYGPQTAQKVVLNLRVGQVEVSFPEEGSSDRTLWMQQIEPTFGDTLEAGDVIPVLNLNEEDIDSRYPIEQVSTGLPFIIVPLKTLDALKRTSIVREHHDKLIETTWGKIILAFSPEGYEEQHDLSVRVFPVAYGIPEDPATGSGNGCLAAYLFKNRYFQSSEIDIRVGQGYEMRRPSVLCLRAREQDGHIKIFVGGKVILIAEGWWC